MHIKTYTITFFCISFFLCLCLAPVKAFTRDFTNFSMDVPQGWYTEQAGNTFRFLHPENNCIINIVVEELHDVPFRELAIGFYQSLYGENAQNVDGGFTFDMLSPDNIPGRARLTPHGEIFVGVAAVGQCVPYEKNLRSLVIYDKDKKPIQTAGRVYPVLQGLE